MDKGRSKFTSGGVRRQGTEVHEDRRTKRRRTRADNERAAVEVDYDFDDDDLVPWLSYYEAMQELDETPNEVSFNRRTRR